MLCGDDHFTKEFPRCEEINKVFKNNPTMVVLIDPFLSQQQLIDHTYLHGPSSSTEKIRMMFAEIVVLTTWNQTYDKPLENKYEGSSPKKTPSSNPSPPPPFNGPLTIGKPSLDTILCPPDSTIQNIVFNPNARVPKFYNIVEDLNQAPCTMSTLEVLQIFPTQQTCCYL